MSLASAPREIQPDGSPSIGSEPHASAAPAAPPGTGAPRGSSAAGPGAQQVKLDTANLKSSYCNMCNANTTREEVVLNFGVNQNWDRGLDDLAVSLEHRIILSPFAAKRLAQMLSKLVEEYESRYGALK